MLRSLVRFQLAPLPRAHGYPVSAVEISWAGVTKRLIEVDDEKLEAVRELLGTRTLKATVDEAFDEVLALASRRKALLAARGRDESNLADPDARRTAWG